MLQLIYYMIATNTFGACKSGIISRGAVIECVTTCYLTQDRYSTTASDVAGHLF